MGRRSRRAPRLSGEIWILPCSGCGRALPGPVRCSSCGGEPRPFWCVWPDYRWLPSVERGVATRGIVRGWSGRARFRLMVAAAKIEWPRRPLALITLTYPRHFSSDPADWKEDLRRFAIWWERKFGEKLQALWAMEFQHRGAPHFHLAAVLPRSVALDDVADRRTQLVEKGVRSEVAEAWYAIAGHGDIRHLHQHLKREHCKVADGARGLAQYLRRELGKERQKTLPDWLDDPEAEIQGAGRWWGRFGLEYADVTELVTADEYQMLRRLTRRLLRGRRLRRAHRHEFLTAFDRWRRSQWRLAEEVWRALRTFRCRAGPRGSFAELEDAIRSRAQLRLWAVA